MHQDLDASNCVMFRQAFKGLAASKTMAFSCPPELLLRNAIRARQASVSASPTASSSSSYTAAVCTQLGKPLVIQSLPREKLQEGMVRIAVRSAAVNFSDILLVQGKYQEKKDPPFVVGGEFAGEVIELGEGVTSVKVGDRVFALSMGGSGCFAQECTCPAMALSKIPSSVSYDQAASFLCSYGTAYLALTRKANIKPGETVLVTAAAGAVGMAAVDLAANIFKCRVIGAVGDASKCAEVKARGASDCVVYSTESLRTRVKELTDGNGADIIFDAVGGKVMDECVRCIAFEGRIVVIGFASGDIPRIPANLLLVKSCTAVGCYWGGYAMRYPPAFHDSVTSSANLLAQGKITPTIAATYPLSQINEAFKFITDRKNVGKVIIHP